MLTIKYPQPTGDLQVPEVLLHQAGARAPLLRLPEVHPQDGPPLPLGQQLRRREQPKVLRPFYGGCDFGRSEELLWPLIP